MSKMTMQATVKGVEPRVIKSGQPDARTIYDVVDQNGEKWTAWERPLAEQAWALKDQTVVWTVEVKPSNNPKYGPNRTLVDIGGQASAPSTGGFPPAPVSAPAPAPATFDAPGSTLTPKDTSIHRQTAAKVVGNIASAGGMTPDEFWSNITDLVHYFETGETPIIVAQARAAQAAQYVHPNISNPTGFPSETPPPLGDDDIPF